VNAGQTDPASGNYRNRKRNATMGLSDPVLLFFLFGLTAGLLRSELRLPASIYKLVSMLLLLSIGLKGASN
jgi:hypothetical protein